MSVVVQGIGVVLPVENKMRNPQAFGGWFGVIDLAMTVAMVLYAAVGFYGYLKFGKDIQGSITLNLPCHEGYELFVMYVSRGVHAVCCVPGVFCREVYVVSWVSCYVDSDRVDIIK